MQIETKINIQKIINALPLDETEHMHRVAVLTGLLSEKAYLTGVYEGDAGWNGYGYFGQAAFYHDIGKAWVPRELLMKAGILTGQEKLVLRLHPMHAKVLYTEIENDVVLGIPKHLLLPAFQSAEYHHERWDGNGYPHGLEKTEIPLIARLTAICDAYDTITSKRAYKEALSHDIACRELRKNAGTQFDPVLSEVFLKYENLFYLMKERKPV